MMEAYKEIYSAYPSTFVYALAREKTRILCTFSLLASPKKKPKQHKEGNYIDKQ